MRTQSKTALILFLSTVLIMLMFAGAVYYSLNKYSYNDFYKRLATRARISAKYNFQADRLSAESLKAVREEHLEKLLQEKEYLIAVGKEADFKTAARVYELPEHFLGKIYTNGQANLKAGDTFFSGIRYASVGNTYLVIVSAENYYSSHHLSFLRNIMWFGIVLLALITVGFSIYFSRRVFDPIRQITLKVKEISTDNIHLRLEEHANNHEISELILTFNDLLNRLETAFETQKNFISNASHEFGTPLTSIMGEAEVTLIKDRSVEEYRETLQNVIKQAERLDQITKSLLFLAQTGYGAKKIQFDILRTDEITWAAKEIIDKLNPQNKIYIDLNLLPEDPKKLKIRGNKDLLQLAIANILNNGCKYSRNKPVSIGIAATNTEVIIVIRDEGIGIPEHEIQYIYDPFFRASNTHFYEGYGIGLPLSRNIIKVHNGSLVVTSVVNSGTTVKINLPLVKIN